MTIANTTQRSGRDSAVPAGTYRLDPTASTVTFTTRFLFGLLPVRGRFGTVAGTLTVTDDGSASGVLDVAVETIDTGIAKRDAHLNRSDFFHTAEYPEATFTLEDLRTGSADGPHVRGTVTIRDKGLPVHAPVTVSATDGRVRIEANAELDHHAAGLPFRRPLMISGRARVRAELVYTAA